MSSGSASEGGGGEREGGNQLTGPSESDGSKGSPDLLCDLLQCGRDLHVVRFLSAAPDRLTRATSRLNGSRGLEFSLTDDSERGESHALVETHGLVNEAECQAISKEGCPSCERRTDDFALEVPPKEVVLPLVEDERRKAVVSSKVVRLHDDPGGGIGDGRVQDLAVENELVQATHDFLD